MKQNLKNGIAAQGYDVMSFFEGNPKKGNAAITYNYDGAEFQFSSELNKVKFKSSPEAFIPQYGGYCAYRCLKEKKLFLTLKVGLLKMANCIFLHVCSLELLMPKDNG